MSIEYDLCGHTKSFCHCAEDLTKVLERGGNLHSNKLNGIIEPELRGGLYTRDDVVEDLLDALHDIALLAAEESEWEGDAYADIRDRAIEAQREYEHWERGENHE